MSARPDILGSQDADVGEPRALEGVHRGGDYTT